jgi:RNA polymerase sigma-70 factor (TIGR02943 family)
MPTRDTPTTTGTQPDLCAWRTALLRFARTRLRNPALAEDAVSETLLAALERPRSFDTAAEGAAWLYGVLRHKLVDQLRQQARETPAGDSLADGAAGGDAWVGEGAWMGYPSPFDAPEDALCQREFLALVQRCCERLPTLQRQAFQLRELLDVEPELVCQQLGITPGHLWVLVHRAKARLRALLRAHWPLPEALEAAPPGSR